jgi:5-methylcytosine-specific restriction endonuclease McrA
MGGAARKQPSLKERLEILIRQATCPRCGEKLGALADLEWDHIQPLALGGDNSPENFQAVHRDCHALKTRGNPATTAGSDIHAIARVKRLARKEAEFRSRLLAPDEKPEKPKRAWGKRSFPKRPKSEKAT